MKNEKSIFLRTFGDTPILRVMDFLIIHSMYDYSMTDIANNSKVGYTTLKLFWKKLIDSEIVIQTRTVGKAKMYQLNRSNLIVKQFIKMYNTIVETETEKILKKEQLIA